MGVFRKTRKTAKTPISTTGPGLYGIAVIAALITWAFAAFYLMLWFLGVYGRFEDKIAKRRCKRPAN